MLRIVYDEAVLRMTEGLLPYLAKEDARHFAGIFAGNSLDGVYSHGMNRYARYLSDMETGLCDARVTRATRVSGFGALEIWDAAGGVGPLIAEQMAQRVIELAREHGIGCCALRNNSHWLRAGRYGLMIADAGLVGLCFTNTCQNLTAWGTKAPSLGNNPFCLALPRAKGSLLMDMAVSQYAYGKLEIMAQEGKMLPQPIGYDLEGNETCDPGKICESGLMMPMAMWKGNALSIMLDLAAMTLSGGRSSLQIGPPSRGETRMSQVYIAVRADIADNLDEVADKTEAMIDFLHSLPPADGVHGVHVPGENLQETRRRNLKEGIPVTEITWQRILEAAERGRRGRNEEET